MKKAPLVSIVVPTHNRASLLTRALDSLRSQTFVDYEVIVVDDGSTDETRSSVEAYLSEAGFTYVFQENKGVAEARNTGVRHSRGEYIAFCDSDDFWSPQKLEKQVPLFTSQTDLVFTDAYFFTDASLIKGRFYDIVVPHKGRVYDNLLRENFIVTSSVIVRKSTLRTPFTGRTCEDWRMWLAVSKSGLVDYVDEPLVYYYEHDQGLSKAKAVLISCRLALREDELAALHQDARADDELMRAVRSLILKDKVLLKILAIMPDRLMKKVSSMYYGSTFVRRAMKAVIGS